MYKLIKVSLLSLVIILLLATPVLAYLYRAPLTILESSGNAYSMLPVMVSANNQWMADNGFMEADALDTRVQTLGGLNKPHMVSDNRTATAVPVPTNSQTNLYFVTGESDLSSMDIIVGYGGYVTILDAGAGVALEPGNNFDIEIDGYIDTTAGADKDLLLKDDAFKIYVSSTDNITAEIGTAVLQASHNAGDDTHVDLFGDSWKAQSFTTGAAHIVTSVKIKIFQSLGNPGTVTVSIRATAGNLPTGTDLTSGTTDGDTLGASPGVYREIDLAPYLLEAATEYAIVVRVLDGDAANYLGWRIDSSTGYAGGRASQGGSGGGWALYPVANDFMFEEWGYPDVSVTAPVTSGEHILGVSANVTNMWIDVDGVTKDIIALAGASVTPNANDWLLNQNNVMPYMEYYKHTVGGTLIAHYEPVAIILGTVLPDREGAAQNGAITWGSNPAGVSVSLGSMESSGQPSVGVVTEDIPSSVLPEATVSDWFGDGTVGGAILTNPIRPFITMVSDNTDLTEILVWRWMGVALLLFVAVASAKLLRGHLGITVIIVAAAMGGLVAVDHNIYPLWLLVMAVGMFLGGIVAERSPSL